MSYELSGLGGAATPMPRVIVNWWNRPVAGGPGSVTPKMQAPTTNKALTFGIQHPMSLSRHTKLPHPSKLNREKRRTPPHIIGMTITRLPASAVQPSNLSGLGFSLKPPKWVRKLTIKKVIKPLAITAAIVGAAFIPGALPLLGKGVGLLGKGVIGAGKFAGTRLLKPLVGGVTSVFRKPAAAQGAQTQAQYDAEQAAANQAAQAAADQSAANAAANARAAYDKQVADQLAVNQAAYDKQLSDQAAAFSTAGQAAPIPPPSYAPQSAPSYSGGGGGYSAPTSSMETEAPAQAGMGNSLIPIGIGLIALVAVSGAMKRGRR
jgi:hypothetical protein